MENNISKKTQIIESLKNKYGDILSLENISKRDQKEIKYDDEIIKNLSNYFQKDVAKNIYEYFWQLSRPQIESFSKVIWGIRYKKYPHTRGRKLGEKTKALPDGIYKKVIDHFKNKDEELALAYEIEGIEGSRVGDTLRLKLNNIDFQSHILHIYNHKSKRWYQVPIAPDVEDHLHSWINIHNKEIKEHDNFIFFTRDDKHHPNRKENHLTQQYVNRKLVAFLDSIGAEQVYAIRNGDGGKLHLYTTHSGRGHAATRIKNLTGKKEDAAKLLNHSPRSAETTELYFERDENELFEVMRRN